MRIFITGIVLIFTIICQSTLVQFIEILNTKPNLIIMLIIYFALLRGNIEGGIVGFFGGLLLDISMGKAIGINSLIGMYIGIAVGSFNKRFYKESYLVALLFTFVFTILYELIFYFLNYFLWGDTRIIYAFNHFILPETVYNCILTIPVYALISKTNRKFIIRERNTRKY